MQTYQVTLTKPGAGSGALKVTVQAATPDEARVTAENQYAGYVGRAVLVTR